MTPRSKDILLCIFFLIVAVSMCVVLLNINPHGHDTESYNLTIHVNERVRAVNMNTNPYIITDTNVVYNLYGNDLYYVLQPGYNYTVEITRPLSKPLRSNGTNGSISRAFSKEV